MTETTLPRVVIAGGGVAALETLIALREHARDRVAITLLAPEPSFTYRPMTVAEPFAMGHAQSYELARVAERFDAELVQDVVAEVAPLEAGPPHRQRQGARLRPPGARDRGAGDARPRARHHLRRGPRGGGAARAAPRRGGGLLQAHRVRGAERDDLDAAALRARADDGARGVDDGGRPPRDRLRDPRGPAGSPSSADRRATRSPSCSTAPASSSWDPRTPPSSAAT